MAWCTCCSAAAMSDGSPVHARPMWPSHADTIASPPCDGWFAQTSLMI